MEKVAVLLLGYGAPSSPKEVKSFVKNLVWEISGRELSEEALAEVENKYQAIGGSPYLEISQRQKEMVENYLKRRLKEKDLLLELAYRYCEPSFSQALNKISEFNPDQLFLVSLSPFPSPYGSSGYFQKIRMLLKEVNFSGQALFIDNWSEHPSFFQAWQEKIAEAKGRIPKDYQTQTKIVFSFHSLPLKTAEAFPEYLTTIKKTVSQLEKILGEKGEIAFQSGKKEGWLVPSLKAIFKKAAEERKKALLVVPLGFIADHLETLYDLDIEAKNQAEELGLGFYRVPALNDSPLLVKAISETILRSFSSR